MQLGEHKFFVFDVILMTAEHIFFPFSYPEQSYYIYVDLLFEDLYMKAKCVAPPLMYANLNV